MRYSSEQDQPLGLHHIELWIFCGSFDCIIFGHTLKDDGSFTESSLFGILASEDWVLQGSTALLVSLC